MFKACDGYCLSRDKYHREAIAAYEKASECGYDSPALLNNNMGFSYLSLNQVDRAEECLIRAIELDDNLQAAHHNMVRVFLLRAMRGQPIPKVAFVHAVKAIAIGPESAELFHCVAALHAVGAKQDPTLIQPAIDYVGSAIRMGFRPEAFTSDTAFSALRSEAALHDVMKKTATMAPAPKAIQVLDPLDRL